MGFKLLYLGCGLNERNARQSLKIKEINSGNLLQFFWGGVLVVVSIRHDKGSIYNINWLSPGDRIEFYNIRKECINFIETIISECKEEEEVGIDVSET